MPQRVIQPYLFSTRTGKPVEAPNFNVLSWRKRIREAGMPDTLTFHKLRHGAASLLLNEGVPVPVVSRYLGHANPGITMKVYWPDPVFCTRCYESVSTDSSSSGLPAFSTFLSRSAATANSAGVR